LAVILVNTQNSRNAEAAQKILASVPYAQGFHFFMPDGHYTGETAMSICSFLRDLKSVDVQSIKFHLDRGDFQKWLRNTVGDQELAGIIDSAISNFDKGFTISFLHVICRLSFEFPLLKDGL
jgi:hypothetical protein